MPNPQNNAKSEPLISLRPYQTEPFWRDDLGMMLLLWRRQSGKSTTLASKALRRMMQNRNLLVTYVSASLNLGREFIVKEAQIFNEALEKFRRLVAARKMRMETTADNLSFDDFCDIFESQKLETKIWHDRSTFSRSHIIAPNVATARSWTGDVFIDEIGFIRDFKDMLEALEPIMSSDSKFRCLMATTPPNDDSHFSYELSVPPVGMDFPREKAKANGHWYLSQAGIWVHRADAFDTELAGVRMYDINTRKPITPDESRAKALDRDAWDRNYWLIFKVGGSAAVSLMTMHQAMQKGSGKCLAAEDDFPEGWEDLFGDGVITIGADPATTENDRSNPFAITVLEYDGAVYWAKLIVRFKTRDDQRAKQMLKVACSIGNRRRLRKLVVDASSEKFWCAQVKRELSAYCPVELVVAGEKIAWQGEEMNYKQYQGNLLVNNLDDGRVALPEERWIRDDFRLVMKSKGSFDNRVDAAGNHGDTFDSTKHALHGQISPYGKVEVKAVSRGAFGVDDGRVKNRLRPDHSGDGVKPKGFGLR